MKDDKSLIKTQKSWLQLFRANKTVRRIASNSSWLLLERVANMTVRFFVSVWVVRYLGPENYGTYAYAASFTGLFMALATLGLDPVVVRNLSRKGDNEADVLGTAFALRLTSGVTAALLVGSLSFVLVDDWITRVAIFLASTQLLFKASDICDFWFQSEIQSKYPVFVRTGLTVMVAMAQVILILSEASVLPFVAVLSVQMFLQAVGTAAMYVYVRADERPSWTFRRSLAWSMLRDAWPLIFAGLSVSVYMKVDQVMVGEILDQKAVGLYATAVKISELWYFIPVMIAGSVFPKIVEAAETNPKERYERQTQTFFDAMALMAYVIIIPVLLTSHWIIGLLFGENYHLSGSVLQVHIWAFLFVALGVARGKWLVAENLTRFAMYAAIAGAISNVLLNIIMIPRFGILGAAWATLLSQFFAAYLTGIAVSEIRNVFWQMTCAIFAPFRLRQVARNVQTILKSN